jgi:hypothetical protein
MLKELENRGLKASDPCGIDTCLVGVRRRRKRRMRSRRRGGRRI